MLQTSVSFVPKLSLFHCNNFIWIQSKRLSKVNHVCHTWSNEQGQIVEQSSTFWFPECWLMKTRTPFSAMAWSTIEEVSELGMLTSKEISWDRATSYLEPALPGTVLWKQNWVAAAASLSSCCRRAERNCVGLIAGVRCVAANLQSIC